jgi:hypothetical protein
MRSDFYPKVSFIHLFSRHPLTVNTVGFGQAQVTGFDGSTSMKGKIIQLIGAIRTLLKSIFLIFFFLFRPIRLVHHDGKLTSGS